MDWAKDKRGDMKSGSKLDLGSKEESENCLEGGEKEKGICATAAETAVDRLMGIELDDGFEEALQKDELPFAGVISDDEDDKDEQPDSSNGDSRSSDMSEETEPRRENRDSG